MDNDMHPFNNGGRDWVGPMGFDHHGGGPHALGWVIFALQLLMLAGLAVLLVRAFAFPRGPRGEHNVLFHRHVPPPHDPLEQLRFRYARGEISREEYLQATRDLGGDAATEDLPAG